MISTVFHKKIRKAGCVFLGAVLLLFALLPAAGAKPAAPELEALIVSAFEGRRAHVTDGESLLANEVFLEKHCGAGTGDWAAFAIGRYAYVAEKGTDRYYTENCAAYAAALEKKLADYYENTGVKPGAKLTEYFRMGLALTALGGSAEKYIAAATLQNQTAMNRMAIMTLIYGLLAVDMRDLAVAGAQTHTPQDYVDRLLSLRLSDGGWSLNTFMGGVSDVDVTAMALSALAPYYRRGDAAVKTAAEEALAFLSGRQRPAGDFASYGSFNAESTAQVITALCCMGIDPLSDARFIKNGKTALDGLLNYRLPDGSFTHSFTADPDNGAAVPGNYNYLATDEASYALVALWRLKNGMNPLYDLRPEEKPDRDGFLQKLLSAVRAFFSRLAKLFVPRASAAVSAEALRETAREIVEYKKTALGRSAEEPLFKGDFLQSAGSTAGDWYPIGMAALGLADDYPAYLAALRENVRQRYASPEKLSSDKATEWHRAALAALACGADPTRFTVTESGEPVNLIADGVFRRERIDRQGINGCIWALIALHTRDYPAPADALNTEESLTAALLAKALPEGGWNMRGAEPDTDVTAMALIALAPLYGTDARAAAAIDAALEILSRTQTANGGFTEEGVENCESSAVTITALCTLGIDPLSDPRFIKNGRTALDALLSYRLPDGSFTHAFTVDAENPSAVPNEPNDMSCQQALYALAALCRLQEGAPGVFDHSADPLSDAGWNALPEPPNAAELAANSAKQKLAAFFADGQNRRAAVTAALAVCVLLLAAALTARALRRKKEKE